MTTQAKKARRATPKRRNSLSAPETRTEKRASTRTGGKPSQCIAALLGLSEELLLYLAGMAVLIVQHYSEDPALLWDSLEVKMTDYDGEPRYSRLPWGMNYAIEAVTKARSTDSLKRWLKDYPLSPRRLAELGGSAELLKLDPADVPAALEAQGLEIPWIPDELPALSDEDRDMLDKARLGLQRGTVSKQRLFHELGLAKPVSGQAPQLAG